MLPGEQQNQLAQTLTTGSPNSPDGEVAALPASVLIALATNDAIAPELIPNTEPEAAIAPQTNPDQEPTTLAKEVTAEQPISIDPAPLNKAVELAGQNNTTELPPQARAVLQENAQPAANTADRNSAPLANQSPTDLRPDTGNPRPASGGTTPPPSPDQTGTGSPSLRTDIQFQPAGQTGPQAGNSAGAQAGTEPTIQAGSQTAIQTPTQAGKSEFAPLVENILAKGGAAQTANTAPLSEARTSAAGELPNDAVKNAAPTSEAAKIAALAAAPKIDLTEPKSAQVTDQASGTGSTRESSALPSTSSDSGSSDQQNSEGRPSPASLMDRLKPLQQAGQFFQADASAQNSAKTPDITAAALSITPGAELARPAGLEGMIPGTSNPTTPQVPLNNLAVHIAAQAKAGNQKFNIRLDPPELGRIDIRLEITRDGQTLTHLAVEKPETLDLLRQDSRALERALGNAGLDSRNGSLSFSLREDNANKQQAEKSDQDDQQSLGDKTSEDTELNEAVIERTLNVSGGLDISI